jgi:hypothetical protein
LEEMTKRRKNRFEGCGIVRKWRKCHSLTPTCRGRLLVATSGGEEGFQVGEREFCGSGVGSFEDVGEERAFFVLQGEDFFFDGAAGDELVAGDDASLADTVGAVSGLRFGGGIPPRIEVDDGVGGGEVEAGAAGF